MKYIFRKSILTGIFLISSFSLLGQTCVIKGKITDAETGKPLVGVNITVKDKMIGTSTNNNGIFALQTKTQFPFNIIVSYIGFKTKEIKIKSYSTDLNIQLSEHPILGQEVVVSASRVEESIMRSPVSIEKLTPLEIEQISAPNFFDGLYQIKGVDMNVHSLTFRYPNTRGFNGESNTRMNQIVDGVENIPPGLSFSAGNIFGLSPLDVESIELLVGASSALYGPGGINGSLLMNSKNPFDYPGLSGSLQTGLMHVDKDYQGNPTLMEDFNFRFARVFNDRLAFKIIGRYLNANDWHATDYRDKNHLDDPSINRHNNPGYDGVNVYGDDLIAPVNLKKIAPGVGEGIAKQMGFKPGSYEYDSTIKAITRLFPDQVISRTGWKEEHLVDYNTKILMLDGSVHYRMTESLEGLLSVNYGKGTSVYTAHNRFSLKDFHMTTIHAEVKNPNYYIRGYTTIDNSGDTYNAGGAGMALNEKWKPSKQWYERYIGVFTMLYLMDTNNIQRAYDSARVVADNRYPDGKIRNPEQPALPQPGTEEFDEMLNDIKSKHVSEGGAKVFDNSKLYHLEGMYNFKEHFNVVDLIIGASYRLYRISSEGTVFYDKPGDPITINQFGAFTQITKKFLNDKLKITLAGRFDKNQYFKGRLTPRFSLVYSIDNDEDHNLRGSIQTAYRFPTVADQWVNLDVGAYRVIGGLPEVREQYNFDEYPAYPLTGRNPITDSACTECGYYEFPEFSPERVLTYEVGYKGLFLGKKLYIDAYIFLNKYNGFIAYQVLEQYTGTDSARRFQVTVSTVDPLSSFGWALGLDYRTPRGFMIRGNVAYNALQKLENKTIGFESRFNTPRYRFNISAGKRKIFKRFGFNISYRWQDEFLWQSPFGTAEMPSFSVLDAHISVKFDAADIQLKIGGSNILNKSYTTSFGSAQIGGLYYITLLYDQLMN